MDSPTVPPVPPVPRLSSSRQQQPRRKDAHPAPSRSTYHAPSRHALQIPVGSGPDVISSLITSLDLGPKHSSSRLDLPVRSPAASRSYSPSASSPPRLHKSASVGSFGVDYGAFSSPPRGSADEYDDDIETLAASPPVVRTSKPPSGFSPLTAPKSLREESGGGLKSLLGGSRTALRPSSKGSLASRDADTHSIGNLSIERGAVPPVPELRRQKSHDSWGKKQGRSHKGLMYMSSRERLREKEDKKRASIGSVGNDWLSLGSAPPRQDAFLAEVPINEEPSSSMADAVMAASDFLDPPHSPDRRGSTSPRAIPVRDSSLRKAGTSTRRHSSRRTTKQPDSADAIPEDEEQTSTSKSRHPSVRKHQDSRRDHLTVGDASGGHGHSRSSSGAAEPQSRRREKSSSHGHLDLSDLHGGLDIEEGAPSPSIAQSRRKDKELDGRRISGQDQMNDAARIKRASSRAKNVSASPGNTTPDPMHVSYERPPSADSIDDAVESYMCSPRLSQTVRHPQTGRVISFSEVGDSEGSAVFCCVGMGLTRYITAFYDELALTLGLRLITPDRPGVGDSEPHTDGTATPLGWPDDVYAICQALKITKFSILAHSAGAIYALATALRMPQHIRGRIHLLAPWIPPSQMSVFGASAQTPLPPTNAIPTSQRILRALPTPILRAANSSFMTATSSSITSSLPKTPRKKRKSGANVAVKGDREKEAAARSQANQHMPPLPTSTSPDGNKENNLLHEIGDKPSGIPRGDLGAAEEMDLFKPSINGNSKTASNGRHKRSSSTASAAHAAREAAVLAAAASALADRERQATYDSRLTQAIWELATTGANPAVDLLVCLERRHTIGFRYVDITRPVVIHHGSRDTRVPVENVRWLGKTMKRCEVRVLEGEGHGLMASASVMSRVLAEISDEWKNWSRLTGASQRDRGLSLSENDRRPVGVGGPTL
ncbi:hypothetical protein RB597_008389 [Gaeumannomyces tritici]